MIKFPTSIAPEVKSVIQSYPLDMQQYTLDLRALILDTAAEDRRIGPLTETLKWREPSYLPEKSQSGTTLRFDWKMAHPKKLGIFVNCKTSLIETFRGTFGSELEFEGTRAIWLDADQPMPREILAFCIGKTLTYHLD